MLDERGRLKADLAKTQSELLTKSQSADGDELKDLEKRMESVKLEMESVKKVSLYFFYYTAPLCYRWAFRACLYGAELLGKASYSRGPSSRLFYKLNGLPGWLFTCNRVTRLGRSRQIRPRSRQGELLAYAQLWHVNTLRRVTRFHINRSVFCSGKASNSVCRVTRLHINMPFDKSDILLPTKVLNLMFRLALLVVIKSQK